MSAAEEFAFDAMFHGSGVGKLAGGGRVTGMVAHPDGVYWLITARGGAIGFGAAVAITRSAA